MENKGNTCFHFCNLIIFTSHLKSKTQKCEFQIMKIHLLISISILFVLYCVSQNFSQEKIAEKTFELKGSLVDQDREVLAGANMFFECDNLKSTIVTDENGTFTIKLPVGKCKITLNEAVSQRFAAFIEISENNLNPNNFQMIVEINLTFNGRTSEENTVEVKKYVAPVYPPAAKAVRASGEVVVLVEINRDGEVVSSKAESGHPLLRRAAEAAAKKWLFSAAKDELIREERIVISFVQTDKESLSSSFMKPNRLVVFSPIPFIY